MKWSGFPLPTWVDVACATSDAVRLNSTSRNLICLLLGGRIQGKIGVWGHGELFLFTFILSSSNSDWADAETETWRSAVWEALPQPISDSRIRIYRQAGIIMHDTIIFRSLFENYICIFHDQGFTIRKLRVILLIAFGVHFNFLSTIFAKFTLIPHFDIICRSHSSTIVSQRSPMSQFYNYYISKPSSVYFFQLDGNERRCSHYRAGLDKPTSSEWKSEEAQREHSFFDTPYSNSFSWS